MNRISCTTEIADRFGTVGKGKAVAFLEDMHVFGDSWGTCKFMTRAELGFPEALMDVVKTATGASYTSDSM